MNEWGGAGVPFLLLVDFAMANPLLYEAAAIPDGLRFATPRGGNAPAPVPASRPFALRTYPPDRGRYRDAFSIVMENIQHGNSFLVNLTFPTRIETDLSPAEIFGLSRAKYRCWLRDRFVCFSPETFVQTRAGRIYAYPMKGTIDASLPDAERTILADAKETAEHNTIVDLLRNDLSMVATGVRVDRYRFIDRLETRAKPLLQVSSEISGRLPDDYRARLGDILLPLLPAGSVSGAPKPETLRIIAAAEPDDRGYYTGVLAYFDGEELDSGVMIRYVEQRGGELYFRSGGGVTFMSDAEAEYDELVDKVYLPIA
jgi:para-aminobenzoate synthetase component 1